MPVNGQLWYVTGDTGGGTNARIAYVNDDGTSHTVQVDGSPATDLLSSNFVQEIGLDTAAGFYFAIINDGNFGNGARLVRGSIGTPGAVVEMDSFIVGADPGDSNFDDLIVNALHVDNINNRIYVSVQDPLADAANTGIKQYSYNPLTGAVTDLGFLVTADTDNKAANGVGDTLNVRDFDLDTSVGRLFFVERFDGQEMGLYRMDVANPTTSIVQLVSSTQFADDGSDGYIIDVEVDMATDLVYFSTESQSPFNGGSYDANQNAIWYISENATNGTATKLTLVGLPGGSHLFPGDIVLDQATRKLYVESEEDDTDSTDNVIYVFQLNGAGDAGTLVQTITPSPALTGSGADLGGMAIDALAEIESLVSVATSSSATEQVTQLDLLTAAPDILDVDGSHLNNVTVTISNSFIGSGDNLYVLDGVTQRTSGLITSTNITVTRTTDGSGNQKLTLSGYDTIANYESALNSVTFAADGNNPTNGGANTSRTVTWQVNDGAAGNPSGTVNGGDTNVRTTTFNIQAVNDAPVLDATKSPVLSTVLEDAPAPVGAVGTLVSTLVDFASPAGQVDNVTDVDGTALGIALTGVTGGTLWFSTNSGGLWTQVGSVSDASAILLAANATTRVYFQPSANSNGTVTNAITFRAWDQSTGGNGQTGVNVSVNGNATAFSATNDVASISVTAVSDEPQGTDSSVNASSLYVFSRSNFGFSDVDGDTFTGVYITSVPAQGVLKNGATVLTGGEIVSTTAIDNGDLTYDPTGVVGNQTFQFQVEDSGTANRDQSANTITLTTENDPPVLTTTQGTTAFTEGDNVTSTPVVIDSGLTVNDNSGGLVRGQIIITENFQAGQDVLGFTSNAAFGDIVSAGMVGNTLTLTSAGAATVTQWQAALRSVTYTNTSETPNTTTRAISFFVTDTTGADALTSTSTYSGNGAGDSPQDIVTADLDGDGNLDLIVANYGDETTGVGSSISVMLGNGDGTFAAKVDYATGNNPASLVVVDVDDDNDLDVVTANYNMAGAATISVLLGDGSGTLAAATNIPTGDIAAFALTSGFFDGDANLDLAVASRDNTSVTIMLGDGAGGFTPGAVIATGDPGVSVTTSVATGDLNGDTFADLVIVNELVHEIRTFFGDGAGNFTQQQIVATGTGSPTPFDVVLADFDGDNDLDAAVTNILNSSVGVLLNTGGTFAAAVEYSVGGDNTANFSSPIGIVATDFNRDGKIDLVVANASRTTASVLLGNGDGTFQAERVFSVGSGAPFDIAVGDFDNNGQLDFAAPLAIDDLVAVVTFGTQHVSVASVNDAAIVTGDDIAVVQEAGGIANGTPGIPTDTGDLGSTDADGTADAWNAVTTATASTGGYGTYTITSAGVWVYTLDNTNATVQALNGASTLPDSFTVTTADGTSHTVNVTINAQNDTPVITGTTTGDVEEAGGVNNGTAGIPSDTGNLDSDDVDNPDDSWNAVLAATASIGGYGAYTLSAAGAWAYTLNDNNATVQALEDGETLSDTFAAQTVDGTTQTVTITITGQNDAPALANVDASVSFTENASAIPLDAGTAITLTDVDNGTLAQATVAITTGFLVGDLLSADTTGTSILLDYDSSTGVLTLSGSDTRAHYEQVLRTVTFISDSDNPGPSRTVTWSVTDEGPAPLASQPQTTTIAITEVNDRPFLLDAAPTAAYEPGSSGVTISPNLVAGDFDATAPSSNLGIKSAAVEITDYVAGDQLFVNLPTSGVFIKVDDGATTTNISVLSNSHGRLVLSGVDTPNHYQQVLDAVSYRSTAADPSIGGVDPQRTITWQINDGAPTSPSPLLGSALTPNTTGDQPQHIATGDLNGDGVLDLVSANKGTGVVSVLLGNGNGTFGTKVDYAAGADPRDVTIGDLNGDGILDLAVASNSGNQAAVLIGNGNGTFAAPTLFNVGGSPLGVRILDINNDGRGDIVTANQTGNNISVLLNTTPTGNPTPTFSTQAFPVVLNPTGVASGDFNNDGKTDVVVSALGSADVSVLLNSTPTGSATASFFAAQAFSTGASSVPESVAVGDLNGDGKLDIVTADHQPGGKISVLLNTTVDGSTVMSFTPGQRFDTGDDGKDVELRDMNGDGKLDVVVSNNGGNGVDILLNTMAPGSLTPSFAAPLVFSSPGAPWGIAVGDYNGDGTPDVAVASSGNDNISILLGTGSNFSNVGTTVLSFNAPPTVDLDASGAGTGFTTTYTERDAPIPIVDTDVLITDPDNAALIRATVVLTNAKAGDQLSVAGPLPGGIDFTIDTSVPGQITLTLTNAASLADYQTALGQVRFKNGSTVPDVTDRDITVTATDTTNSDSNVAHATVHIVDLPNMTSDFNADGLGDILWQNIDGTPAVWLLNGVNVLATGPALQNPNQGASSLGQGGVPAPWHEVGSADFNGDGKSDILWQNSNGTPAVWLMDGVNVLATGPALSNPGPSWHANEAADFNGDGKADILWQNDNGTPAVWLMDGVNVLSTGPALNNPGPTWHEKAAADFNGDGKADILWQNDNGTPAVWLMDGVDVLAMGPALSNPGPSWKALAAADFNGDGNADILWQNADGTPAVWLMDGVNVLVTGPALHNPGASWHVKEAIDANGDGMADILWQNDNGTPAVWTMHGVDVFQMGPALSNPGSNWHIV